MISLDFDKHPGPLTALFLGAHSDDIEIGCGGTVLQLIEQHPDLRIHWVVLTGAGPRNAEALKAASLFTAGSQADVTVKDFRDGYLPHSGPAVKDFFEELKASVQPDVIFTHWQGDAHQDHRLVSELTWNTWRNHMILEYEIPKYDGDLGQPSVYMPLEPASYTGKIDHLFAAFESQSSKAWFTRETFLGLMRIRGMESNSPSGYAEAFHARKIVLSSTAQRKAAR